MGKLCAIYVYWNGQEVAKNTEEFVLNAKKGMTKRTKSMRRRQHKVSQFHWEVLVKTIRILRQRQQRKGLVEAAPTHQQFNVGTTKGVATMVREVEARGLEQKGNK